VNTVAILKSSEIRAMNQKELGSKLKDLRSELSRERAHVSSGTRPENPGRLRIIRRTIARILTITREEPKTAVKEEKATKKGAAVREVKKEAKKTTVKAKTRTKEAEAKTEKVSKKTATKKTTKATAVPAEKTKNVAKTAVKAKVADKKPVSSTEKPKAKK